MKSNSFMDREFKNFSEALGKVLRVSHPALPTKPENAQKEQNAKPAPPLTTNDEVQ